MIIDVLGTRIVDRAHITIADEAQAYLAEISRLAGFYEEGVLSEFDAEREKLAGPSITRQPAIEFPAGSLT